MAQNFRSLSSLLIVLAFCFLNGATSEEREGKQILLSAVPPYPLYFYANNLVAPVYVNGGDAPVDMDARVTNNYASDATGRTFFRIFGCPTCPTCPAPCPTCPTCPTPACPAIPTQAISLSPAIGECRSGTLLSTAASISPCSRVSSATKGTIDVTFLDGGFLQTVTIGIAAATPNTQIKLTCTVIPTGGDAVAKTDIGLITPNVPITSNGFLQIVASGAANPATAAKLTCSWVSS